jgi:hypothetical protein
MTELVAGHESRRILSQERRRLVKDLIVNQIPASLIGGEQRVHLIAQRGIAATRLIKKCSPVGGL